MKKEILVMIYPKMADFEMILASDNIQNSEKYAITSIAYTKEPIIGRSGMTFIPKKLVNEIQDLSNVEGIIIPGGEGLDIFPELRQLLLSLNEKKKLIAAICIAPEYLARVGILDNIHYTSSVGPIYYEEMGIPDPFNYAFHTQERVHVEGNIITAKGEAFIDFSLEIWDYLGIYETKEKKLADKAEFTPG